MNTLLKISLLLCLSVSSTTYASNIHDVDMREDNNRKRPRTESTSDDSEPSQKRQRLSNTNAPATSAPIKSLKRPRTETPLIEGIVTDTDETMGDLSMVVAASHSKLSEEGEESKSSQSNPSTEDAMQFVWNNPDLIRLIGSFIPGHLHSFCFTSKFNHSTLSSETYLETLLSPYMPSTPKDFRMSPFQFLNFYSKGSFTRLEDYATDSPMNGMRISDNGVFIFFDNNDFQNNLNTKWNVVTKQAINLKGVENIITMTANGKTFLGNACAVQNGGFIFRAGCWNDDHEEATLLPLKSAVDISHDGQSIVGYSLKTVEQESEPVLYMNETIKPLLPLEGITCFTPHQLLLDGTILGWDGPTLGDKKQAVVLQNGGPKKLPEGFRWLDIKSKSNQLVGWYNDQIAEYTEGEVKFLPFNLSHITSFNDGPVVWGLNDQYTQGCWIHDREYSLDELVKEFGIKLGEEEKLRVRDTTKNNRTVVGVIENFITSMKTPFIATLPASWFN
ncbi:MAG: hypothetical protein ACTHJ4_07785 [Candidatus Nucleicultricaceae bacterium]